MGLDIRIRLGLIFMLIGAVLAIFGVLTRDDAALYQRSMQINMNLIWGVMMLIFGAIMSRFGVNKRPRIAPDRSELREAEAREGH
jgi:sulfite exporter TauE/SafE